MKKAIQMWSFRDRVHDGDSLLEALALRRIWAMRAWSLPVPSASRQKR